MQNKTVFDYLPDMDVISEEIPNAIAAGWEKQKLRTVTEADIKMVLAKERLSPDDYFILISPIAEKFMPEVAAKAEFLDFTSPITVKTAAVIVGLMGKVRSNVQC